MWGRAGNGLTEPFPIRRTRLLSRPIEHLEQRLQLSVAVVLSVRIARSVQSNRQEYSYAQQISPLRQRMIEDMTIRNMSPSTQKIYVAAVANFSVFHGRSLDKLTFEDVRDYRLHLISRGLKPNSINPIMGTVRTR
jgi:hypothetical protein